MIIKKMKEWKLRVVNNKFAAIVKLDRFKYVHSQLIKKYDR